MKEFLDIAPGGNEVEALNFLESTAWIREVRCFSGAVFVHVSGLLGRCDVWVVGDQVGPCFLVCVEGFVLVEWHMSNHGANTIVVEVHGVDMGE